MVDVQHVLLHRVGTDINWTETIAIDWNVAEDGAEQWALSPRQVVAGQWQLIVSGVSYADKAGNGYDANLQLPEPQSVVLAALALLRVLVHHRRRLLRRVRVLVVPRVTPAHGLGVGPGRAARRPSPPGGAGHGRAHRIRRLRRYGGTAARRGHVVFRGPAGGLLPGQLSTHGDSPSSCTVVPSPVRPRTGTR